MTTPLAMITPTGPRRSTTRPAMGPMIISGMPKSTNVRLTQATDGTQRDEVDRPHHLVGAEGEVQAEGQHERGDDGAIEDRAAGAPGPRASARRSGSTSVSEAL